MKAVLLFETLGPLTHGADTHGNEKLIRREAIQTPLGTRHVPTITGNSLRHRLVREIIADDIATGQQWTKEQLRWLYNGGAIAKSTNVDTQRIVRIRELMPHIDLLGCSLPDTIVAGRINMGIAWLACWETESIVNAVVPHEWQVSGLQPAHEFTGRNQYYRHDATSRTPDRLVDADRDGIDYAGMPHGGEHVVPGAMFVCGLSAAGLSELSQSCLIYSIEEWATRYSTLGGQSSRGHGQVKPYLWTDSDASSDLYREHWEKHKESVVEEVSQLYVRSK